MATGTVEAVFVTAHGGEPMRRLDEIEAVAGQGLRGDRYAQRSGYWTGVDECQVTFIQGEVLDEITEHYCVDVGEGQHRRNIVTRGIDLVALAGHRFAVGDAVFSYDRPRPPCRYVESITEPGMTRALAARRGGICARVDTGGTIRPGDTVAVIG